MEKENQPKDIHGKAYNRNLFVAVFLVGAFVMVLNQTILATAQPTIMKDFDIGPSTVQWLTTGFALINGIMIPITAWLITRFRTRPLYMIAISSFLIGTVLAYFSTSFNMLLTGRLVQALGAGAIMPLMQTVFLTIFPPEKRGAAMGMNGIVIGLAPAIGPTLSGWIVDNMSWRDLFGMIIPIIAIVMVLVPFFIKDVLPTKYSVLDLPSIMTSTIGFGSLLYGFSNVGTDGWTDHWVLFEIIVGLIFVLIFIYRQLHMEEPFLDIRVFKVREFALTSSITAIAIVAMTGAEMVLPLYIQNVRGQSAFHSGLILLPGAIMMALIPPIAGRIFDKYGARNMVILGMALLTIGTIPFFFLTRETSFIYVIIFYSLRMTGIAMAMMTATTSGMSALPIDKMAHGTASNNTFRQVINSIGTAVMISILTNVTTTHMPSNQLLKTSPLVYKDTAQNAILSGYHVAFIFATVFAFLAFLASFLLSKTKPVPETIIVQEVK